MHNIKRHEHYLLLHAIALIAERLLQSNHWENHIDFILSTLVNSTESSRTSIYKNYQNKQGELFSRQCCEWTASEKGCLSTAIFKNIPYNSEAIGRWLPILSKGEVINENIDTFPEVEKELFERAKIKSTLVIPIFVNKKWWGFIIFSDCSQKHNWYQDEIEAIKVLANILGATIEKEENKTALAEKEKSIAALLNASSNIAFLIHPNGKVLTANNMLAESLGKSLDSIIGKNIFSFLPDQVAKHRKQIIQTIFNTKKDIHFEDENNGKIFDNRMYPVFDNEGQISCIAVNATDITQSKRNERIIDSIVNSTSSLLGEPYLKGLLKTLYDTLQMKHIFIGLLNSQKNKVTTVAYLCAGELTTNFEYDIASTPCENVVGKQICCYPSHIQQSFPDDLILQQMGIESYIGTPLFSSNHQPLGILVVLDDKPMKDEQLLTAISGLFAGRVGAELERWQNDVQLRQIETVFDSSAEGFIITDASHLILNTNTSFSKITGYQKADVINKNPTILASGKHDKAFYAQMWYQIYTSGRWSGEILNRRKDGTILPTWMTISAVYGADGEIINYVATYTDLTEIKQSHEQLSLFANYDTTTELPNRRLFQDRLNHALEQAKRENKLLAVIIVGLDYFKGINEAFGNEIGDKVLQNCKKRMMDLIRKADTLARLSGDEFGIILENMQDIAHVAMIANNIVKTFHQACDIDQNRLSFTVSVGVSIFPDDANNASDLLKGANAAIHYVKTHGRNNYHFFSEKLTENAFKVLQLETLMRIALTEEQFFLVYQPQVDMVNKQLLGAEVLVRWNHPEKGFISPMEFIPLAEERGLIIVLGIWILRKACLQMQNWLENGYMLPKISVNVSSKQLEQTDFVMQVEQVLAETKLAAKFLELEITEGAIMKNKTIAQENVHKLSDMGIHIAIDDFGTGYSSLSYLKQLPIHKLKIDKSFVDGLPENLEDGAICNAIIAMTQALNIEVIAEGIEKEPQQNFLLQKGCLFAQGYFFYKPLLAEELIKLL